MRRILFLMAVVLSVLHGKSQETRPVVDTAPGEENLYKGEFVAKTLREENKQFNETFYRINFNEDKAYIFNLFSVCDPVREYVVADVADKVISIPTGYSYKETEFTKYVVRRFVRNSQDGWDIDLNDEPVKWIIGDDGVIRDEDPDVKIGLVLYFIDEPGDPGMETYIFDDIKLTPFELTNTDLPEDVTEKMEFRVYVKYDEETFTNRVIEVARNGEDFYFKKLYSDSGVFEIDCWVKGTLSNGTLSIPSRQLVGVDMQGYLCYNSICHFDMTSGAFVIDEEPATFTCDDTVNKLTTGNWLMLTQGFDWPALYFPNPELTKFEKVAATPAKPVFISYTDEFFDYSGETWIAFLIPYEDVDGNFIDPNNITFSMFLDSDEPYVFEPSVYPNLNESMSVFGFYDNIYKYVVNTPSEGYQRHVVYFLINSYQKVGVQSYYSVNGVRNASEMMWYDRSESNVNTIQQTKEIANIETFDLLGRRVSDVFTGIVIKKITYTDGTVETVKTISKIN